jgi:PAS domain-containing protein
LHKLFAKLLAKATTANGDVDLAALGDLVSRAFEEADTDRRRTDRSIALMIEEVEQLTRGLEKTVQQRTRELHQREDDLRAQSQRFEVALNHMAHGLVMFDAQARVVMYNQRYLDMYKIPPDQVKPGATLAELLRLRAEAGLFAGDPDLRAAQLVQQFEASPHTRHNVYLPDGRTISVSSRRIPRAGWVITHEDITERPRREQEPAAPARDHAPLVPAG